MMWIALALGLLSACGESESTSTTVATRGWYSGGTLHDSDMKSWARASYRNRLATSADFAAAIMKSTHRSVASMDALRPYAERMEECISEAAKAPKVEATRVTEIAAGCQLLFDAGI